MNFQTAFKTLASDFFGQSNYLTVPVALIKFLDNDVSAAMHLNQILYWASRSSCGDGVFYKRYNEWKEELYQSEKRLRRNVAKFINMGILSAEVRRIPYKNTNGQVVSYGEKAIFYEVHWDHLATSFSAYGKSQDPLHSKVADKAVEGEVSKLPNGSFQTPNPGGNSQTEVSKLPNGSFQTPKRKFPNSQTEVSYIEEAEITTETTSIEKQKTLSVAKSPDQTTEDLSSQDQGRSKNNGLPSGPKKNIPSSFDKTTAHKFADVVCSYRKVQKNSNLRQWANTFRQMRVIDGVSEKDIRDTIIWYKKHIGGDFIPEAFSATTFRKKFAEGKFASAMKRMSSNGRKKLTRENMWDEPGNTQHGGILKIEVGRDGQEYDGLLLYQIRRRVLERFGKGLPLPEEMKAVMVEDFPEVEKEITSLIIGRVG